MLVVFWSMEMAGGQALDVIHVGLVHLPQEHTGVGGQALHIPPLTLGIDGVKGQGAFAGAGKARQHHQLIPGDADIDVFQVVLPRTLNENFSLHGMPHFCNIWLQISVVKSIFNVNSEIILYDHVSRFRPQKGDEGVGIALHLMADLARADADGAV